MDKDKKVHLKNEKEIKKSDAQKEEKIQNDNYTTELDFAEDMFNDDLSDKRVKKCEGPYNNRELSWVDFNARVLEEAIEKENPVMERLKFLAITASNLDEFFMVRVAGIMEQIQDGYTRTDPAGLTPKQQLEKLTVKIQDFSKRQYSCLNRSIIPALKKCGYYFKANSEMTDKQLRFVDDYFEKLVFPVLTPMAVDTRRPFPLLANKSLNIAVRLTNADKASVFAVVQVPSILPRFLELPTPNGREFILLEQIIMSKLQQLFELYTIEEYCTFRITRNSDLDIDEETDDLMEEIQKSIKKRKRGKPVRLEMHKKCAVELKRFLVDMLDVEMYEIYEQAGALDLTFLSKFASVDNSEELFFEPVIPVNPPADFYGYNNVFDAIRERDRMVHHPFESFDVVVKFIKQAAEDKDVLAIKQTLYRVSGNSPIIAALIKAAENGKQVTVLVELKARFDEENNIIWAKKLEKAGCHVIYGLTGLKTHCKICLVLRRENGAVRRYLHMGTGNYNDITARFYTDIGMFTCRDEYGTDATSLFNVLTGYSLPPEYNKFIVAPRGMRKFFEKMILKEINNANNGLPSGIIAKVNSLVDPAVIDLLYKASQAGVQIKLIVRGICCLIPGIKDISENITVYSIVGQLLEHSRIFKFTNGGNPQIFMGSADWMQRNLDKRVELCFPIEDEKLKNRSFEILELMMSDNTNARIQLPDTTYVHIDKRGKRIVNSQKNFYLLAKKDNRNAKRHNNNIRDIGTPIIPK